MQRQMPVWRMMLYFVLTTLFFVVGWMTVGVGVTALMFLAIVMLAETGKAPQQ